MAAEQEAIKADAEDTTSVDLKSADSVAKYWWYGALLSFPIFTTFGMIMAIKFFYPTFLIDSAWDTFGRIRPAHVNGLLFGFLSSGLIGSMYYITPRLSHKSLFQPLIGKASAVLWNVAVLAGVLLILSGDTQAREYAEMPWVVDIAIVITLILIGITIIGTIIKRRERKLYVSLWFFAAIFLWFPIVYSIGNVIWNPPSGALYGLTDAIVNWFYGHNVLGLWFTPFGLALWYYFIPKISKRALYSVTLSLISFFALAFFYTGVGGHHLLQSSIPEWLKTIAVATSGLMMISVLTFATNIGMTLRGAWKEIMSNVPLRFIVFGFICYIFVSIQGTFQALRDMNIYLSLLTVDSYALPPCPVRFLRSDNHGHNVLGNSQSHPKTTLEQKTNGCNLVGYNFGIRDFHVRYDAGGASCQRQLVHSPNNSSSTSNSGTILHGPSYRRRHSGCFRFPLRHQHHHDCNFKTADIRYPNG